MAPNWSVVVRNGVERFLPPLSAPAFLRSHPSGAYTTTRTTDHASCILLWERHVARLLQSMRLLAEAIPDFYSKEIRSNAFGWEDSVKYEVEESVKVGFGRALELKEEQDEELILTVLASGNADNIEPYTQAKGNLCDMYVHIASYVLPPGLPAHIAVMGPTRNLPLVKLSSWAKTRQILEQLRPRDATEVLLSKDGDKLLEGLLTNFFVIANINPIKYADRQEPYLRKDSVWDNVEVQTPPLEEGVLPGVIRQLIIESLLENHIRICEVVPSWEKHHAWREAFITSSVRLVQPVASIQVPHPWNINFIPEKWTQCQWEKFNFEGTDGLSELIKEIVIRKVRKEAVPVKLILSR